MAAKDMVGSRVGRYEILRHLASGGMGEVFIATARSVGPSVPVALKVLRPELAQDPTIVKMLIDEARVSMILNHQNIVSVTDFLDVDDMYAIVMEYVHGANIEHILDHLQVRGEKLDPALGMYVCIELCRALRYAHTRTSENGEPLNIVHRDVTPLNVLVSTQGEVKLTDFGIARARGRLQETAFGVLKGRFGYMAPEMTRYEALDARVDLFAVGVMLYLLTVGKHPVADMPVMEAIICYEKNAVKPPSTVNPQIPPELDAIIMRALDPKPEKRWQSAQELGAQLQSVMMSKPNWRAAIQRGGDMLAELMHRIVPETSDELRADLSGPTSMEEPAETDDVALDDTEDIPAVSRMEPHNDFDSDEATEINYEPEAESSKLKKAPKSTDPVIVSTTGPTEPPPGPRGPQPALDETIPDPGPRVRRR